MGTAATLKKISIQLNLSISTVSRALKNHPDISESTKRKVRELAALMDYEPNAYAVNLRKNKSNVFGLIVPAISNMFNDSFIAAVETDARKNGYSLIILQSGDDPAQEAENLKFCKLNRVDGIFISVVPNSISAGLFQKFRENKIPIVFFDIVPDTTDFDTVCVADEEAATIAAHTIMKYKKKNVLALFGKPDLSITRKRKAAFLNVFEQENPGINPRVIFCSNLEETRNAVSPLLKGNAVPDLIFCMSDEILIGVMKSIHRAGWRVPEDIAVLTISNGFIPGLFDPEITYIETSGYELGKLAIKRMMEKMDGQDSSAKSLILPCRLVEGGSLS